MVTVVDTPAPLRRHRPGGTNLPCLSETVSFVDECDEGDCCMDWWNKRLLFLLLGPTLAVLWFFLYAIKGTAYPFPDLPLVP